LCEAKLKRGGFQSLILDETIVKETKKYTITIPKPIANTLEVNELLGLSLEERQKIYKQWFPKVDKE
jgi:bifunctional DNA-binding transcriptional regulator/antitoxin component of YhaV-PrlF toxin-antitoxin module